jgi:2-polyprenyl-3-methyl-5-hydroxy-6-metoxy-1,4-benzoquinol methylase
VWPLHLPGLRRGVGHPVLYSARMLDVKLGPAIRSRLGRWEVPAADAYRSFFINLDDCAQLVRTACPARRILEVGCGDGSFSQRILARYPDAKYVGIDVAPRPGRLFRGDLSRVEFHSVTSQEFRSSKPDPFDLVLLIDVLHHVPREERENLLRDVQAMTASGGHYVVKEWEPSPTFGHWAAWMADRFITGDRIEHVSSATLKRELLNRFGDSLVIEARIPPRRNNYLLGYRR